MRKVFHPIFKAIFFLPEENAKNEHFKHKADFFSLVKLPGIKKINTDNLSCLASIDQREKRNYNRNTLVSLEALYDLKLTEILQSLSGDEVGIYVAGPWGCYNSKVINAVQIEKLAPAKAMRLNFQPKFNLNNLLAIMPDRDHQIL